MKKKTSFTLSGPFNFAATFQHHLAKRGLVEMLPTAWVQALANPETGHMSDLTPGGELVSLQELWLNMQQQGMRDPFTLSAGRYTRDCRLEAGNHRIKLFAAAGVPFVPAVVLVGDSSVMHIANGLHQYERDLLIPVQTTTDGPYDERNYMLPSAVFAEIRDMKKSGLLLTYP